MKLTDLHVRFYKTFNYDYLRKFDRRVAPLPWELMDDDSWYPFVSVPLEQGITTVVGANESGKTQVLDAIEIALTGEGVHRTDFCRYSRFFLVDKVKRMSDLGLTLAELTDDEAAEVGKALGRDANQPSVSAFTLIRGGGGATSIYIRDGESWTTYRLNAKALKQIDAILPHPPLRFAVGSHPKGTDHSARTAPNGRPRPLDLIAVNNHQRRMWMALLVAALLAFGCTEGGNDRDDAQSTSSTGSAAPSTTLDPRSAALVTDYEAFWTALLDASDPPDPDNPVLEAHATDEELERARTVLIARRQAGEALRGSYDHDIAVTTIGDEDAELTDCLIAQTALFDLRSGTEKSRDPSLPQSLTVTLRQEAGTWKVALIEPNHQGCASADTGPSTTSS